MQVDNQCGPILEPCPVL